jgi:RNA polymerase sigma-70 factor (sigma-E family)
VAKRREQRLADLYWRHSADALRLALLLTGDRHAAEDIVQDAFVRLFGRVFELRSPDAFETYLRRTIINISRDRFRKVRLERDHASRAVAPSSPVIATTQVEDREQIRSALRNLPHRQRTALVLRFYVDLSEQQTADLLQCSVPAVKSLIARATATLKERTRGDQP